MFDTLTEQEVIWHRQNYLFKIPPRWKRCLLIKITENLWEDEVNLISDSVENKTAQLRLLLLPSGSSIYAEQLNFFFTSKHTSSVRKNIKRASVSVFLFFDYLVLFYVILYRSLSLFLMFPRRHLARFRLVFPCVLCYSSIIRNDMRC